MQTSGLYLVSLIFLSMLVFYPSGSQPFFFKYPIAKMNFLKYPEMHFAT
jgi:hypothetical protein